MMPMLDNHASEICEVLEALLEYIDELETWGGYTLQDGGLKKPLPRARRILNDANPR